MSKLKEFRESLNYSLTDFSELLGIDKSALCRLEAGKFKPSYGTIMGLRKLVKSHKEIEQDTVDKILDDFLITKEERLAIDKI